MKIKAAVLNKMGATAPYVQSLPLSIDDVELEGPGHGEVLVRVSAVARRSACGQNRTLTGASEPWRICPEDIERSGPRYERRPSSRQTGIETSSPQSVSNTYRTLNGRTCWCAKRSPSDALQNARYDANW